MNKKLLILDIDETLIHSCFNYKIGEKVHDFIFDKYFVHKRPHLDTFLKFCLKNFDVAVWSSGSDDYVQEIVSKLFPNPQDLKFVWGRTRCTTVENHDWQPYSISSGVNTSYIKDLKKVKNLGYSLNDILAVDDSPEKWYRSYGNIIRIIEFTGSSEDNELLYLIEYLSELREATDIRKIEKRGWRNKFIKTLERK